MVTIRYRLTPEDLGELEAERRGGLAVRILRIPAGALVGGIGLVLVWQAIFFFPWNHWFGNLAPVGMGLVFLWVGTDLPRRKWLSLRFSHPFSESEVQIYEGKLVCSRGEKTQQFRWFPKRGFRENQNFFFLHAFDTKLAIPKRVVTPDQEKRLRALAQQPSETQKPDRNEAVECSFFLTQDELNEASAARQNWFLHRWFHTK